MILQDGDDMLLPVYKFFRERIALVMAIQGRIASEGADERLIKPD